MINNYERDADPWNNLAWWKFQKNKKKKSHTWFNNQTWWNFQQQKNKASCLITKIINDQVCLIIVNQACYRKSSIIEN